MSCWLVHWQEHAHTRSKTVRVLKWVTEYHALECRTLSVHTRAGYYQEEAGQPSCKSPPLPHRPGAFDGATALIRDEFGNLYSGDTYVYDAQTIDEFIVLCSSIPCHGVQRTEIGDIVLRRFPVKYDHSETFTDMYREDELDTANKVTLNPATESVEQPPSERDAEGDN